jgi:hypothetical protein
MRLTAAALAVFLVLTLTPASARGAVNAVPTASAVVVNGKVTEFDAYNINGNNYFKLRDLAYALNGTSKQFGVSFDGSIRLESGKPYVPDGGEMAKPSGAGSQAAPTSADIYLDGVLTDFTAFNIGGSNYFKLRDIGVAFDFGVDWIDGAVVVYTGKGYGAPGVSAAAGFIGAQLAESEPFLYVYKDFADGRNYFTQKAFMSDSNKADVPSMDEAAGAAHSGNTCIAAGLDFSKHAWGGYMFVNGVLKAGQTTPELDFGDDPDAKVDLTGATKLVFYAKGENGGERVEFLTGGLGHNGKPYPDSDKVTLGYVTLTKAWTRYEIDLSGADLSGFGCGFAWVTSQDNNPGLDSVKFYLDDISYDYGSRVMFLKSYASVAVDETDQYVINNTAYLYDNAAAVIALSRAGKYAEARQIADAIVYATEHDRYYKDGRVRNAYANGGPKSYNGWHTPSSYEFARMSGYYDAKAGKWFEDYYAVSTSTGNAAWAVMALCEIYANSGRGEYLAAARRIADFILTLKSDSGGFTGGYEGWEPNAVKVTYKSTEHNIDVISAFRKLADLTGEAKYRNASAYARDFVLSMYDGGKNCFYTGTLADGVTANSAVLPIDTNTWSVLTLGGSDIPFDKVMAFVDKSFAVGEGYDFNNDRDGVWFEGTAQAALAYMKLGVESRYKSLLAFLNTSAAPDGSITAADRDGVSTGFKVSGLDMDWEYFKRQHLGATAWLSYAQLGANPFD